MTSPEERPGEQGTDLLAKLFDIRSFTGALFLIFGVIVTIVGFCRQRRRHRQGRRDQPLAADSGRSCSRWAIFFVGLACCSPPELLHGHEVTEDDLPEQLRHHGLEADLPEHRGPEDPGPPRRERTAHALTAYHRLPAP